MAKCANCGWDWFKHGRKNQCPIQPKRGPNDPKQRFKRARAELAKHEGEDR